MRVNSMTGEYEQTSASIFVIFSDGIRAMIDNDMRFCPFILRMYLRQEWPKAYIFLMFSNFTDQVSQRYNRIMEPDFCFEADFSAIAKFCQMKEDF